MKNAARKYVILMMGAMVLAGCGGGGGGGGQLASSGTAPSTLFTSGSGVGSVTTLNTVTGGAIPLPVTGSGGSDTNTIDLNPAAVPEPNDSLVVLLACGLVAGLVVKANRSKA